MKKYILLIIVLLLSTSLFCKKKRTKAVIETNYGKIELELFDDKTPKTVKNFVELAKGKKEWNDPKTNTTTKKRFYDGLTFHRIIPNFMIQGGCPIGNGTGGPGYTFEDETYKGKGKKFTGKVDSEEKAKQVYELILKPYLMNLRGKKANPIVQNTLETCMKNSNGDAIKERTVEEWLKIIGKKEVFIKTDLNGTVDYGTICMANSGPDTNGSQFFIVTKRDGCSWLNGKHTVFGKVTKGMDVVHEIEKLERDSSDRPNVKKMPIIESVKIR